MSCCGTLCLTYYLCLWQQFGLLTLFFTLIFSEYITSVNTASLNNRLKIFRLSNRLNVFLCIFSPKYLFSIINDPTIDPNIFFLQVLASLSS